MFANMKIGVRLGLGFGLLLVLTVVLGWVGLDSAKTLGTQTQKLYDHPFRVTRALLETRVEIVNIARLVRDVVLAPDAAAVSLRGKEIDEGIKAISERLGVARQQFLGDKSTFDKLNKALDAWTPVRNRVIALAADGKREEARALANGDGAARIKDVNDIIAGMLDFARDKAGSFIKNAQATTGRIQTLSISLLIGAVAVGALGAFLAARSITRPMGSLKDAMTDLSQGNIQIDVPAQSRGDEIGDMAKTVQVFKDNAIRVKQMEEEQREAERRAIEDRKALMHQMANDFEASVGHIVQSVSSAATETQTASQSLSATAEQTSHQAGAVAAASEQASANVQTVATATEELSGSIQEIGRQVTQSSQIAGRAVDQANRTDQQVQGLAAAAQKIGEVVSLISDIAEQTNLLALNATIEAARAGDAGKGFAVVASEVKSLANQTARATEDIAQQISGIQAETQEAVTAIQLIGSTINEMSEIASAIASAVEEQSAATGEIARNVEQAAMGTQEVSGNIGGVTQAAAETGTAAGQILGAASDLARQSETLSAEVGKFLAQVRAG